MNFWWPLSHSRVSVPLSLLDLDLFSSEEREIVKVKEGQGAVLLCAPPPHYPGTVYNSWMFQLVMDFNADFSTVCNWIMYSSTIINYTANFPRCIEM